MAERLRSHEAFRRVNDQIYSLRLREVERINRQHSEVVLLTLEQGSQSPQYAAKLDALLQGSRLRSRKELVRDLAERCHRPI